jgi:hypothetical protein
MNFRLVSGLPATWPGGQNGHHMNLGWCRVPCVVLFARQVSLGLYRNDTDFNCKDSPICMSFTNVLVDHLWYYIQRLENHSLRESGKGHFNPHEWRIVCR